MMKVIFLSVLVVFLVGNAHASTPERDGRSKTSKNGRLLKIQKEGGLVDAPFVGKVVRIIDMQDKVGMACVNEFIQGFESVFSFKIEYMKQTFGNARSVIKKNKAGAGLVLTLVDETLDDSIMISPERGWAIIDVCALSADNPTGEVLKTRVVRELWRSTCYALGAANSMNPECVMKQVITLKDLDDLMISVACPEAYDKIKDGALRCGILRKRQVSYRRACIEGYAPAPTNDVQKAIWDKVHQMPSEPLKIKPETKKVSD